MRTEVGERRDLRVAGRSGVGLLVALLVLATSMFPVVSHEYMFHDDWIHQVDAARCTSSETGRWFLALGRPVAYAILCAQFKTVGVVADAALARAVTVLVLAATLFVIYRFLRKESLPDPLAALLALAVVMLPGATASVAWLGAGFIVYAMFVSACAALVCQRAIEGDYDGRAARWALLALGVVLQVIAAATYQTAAMLFLSLAAVSFARRVSDGSGRLLRDLAVLAGVFVVSSLLYFVAFKSIAAADLAARDPARGRLFDQMGQTLEWTVRAALPRALHLWVVRPSQGWTLLPSVVGAAYLLSALAFFARLIHRRARSSGPASLLPSLYLPAAFALCLGSFMPMLVSSFRMEVYRSLVPLSAFFLLTGAMHLWLVTDRRVNVSTLVAACAMAAIGLAAHHAVSTGVVVPATAEVASLRSAMEASVQAGFPRAPVRVVAPTMAESWNSDEFVGASSLYPADVPHMVVMLARSVGFAPTKVSSAPRDVPANEGELVIDLRFLGDSRLSWGARPTPRMDVRGFSVRAKPAGGSHPSGFAFDRSVAPDDFWEARIREEPVVLDIEFGQPRPLPSYAFAPGEVVDRMPVTWRLVASADGSTWTTIDQRADFRGWKAGERERFDVAAPGTYRYYRFVFEKGLDPLLLRIYEIELTSAPTAADR